MNQDHRAREALVAEALGDISELLDRVEALAPTLNSTCEAVTQASKQLEAQVAALESRMKRLAEHAQDVAVKHIAQRTRELMHAAAEAEHQSMAALARALFLSELNPSLQSLLRAANDCARYQSSPRINWWACALSAVASAILVGILAIQMLSP